MRVISKKVLREFWKRHPDAEPTVRAWHREVVDADWATPAQLKARYPRASIVNDNRVVFHLGGDNYRLVAWIYYEGRAVYVKWLGTRAEYDSIDVQEVGL